MVQTHSEEIARLRWQCRRGMLELDLLFEQFVATQYSQSDDKTKRTFQELLNYADQDLFEYFFGSLQPPDKDVADVIDFIRRTTAT